MDYIRLMNSYLIMQVCIALERQGFFEELLNSDKNTRTIPDLAQTLRVKEELLRPCIEFLWITTNLLDKDGDRITLLSTKTLREVSWIFWTMLAYKPVFENVAELLRGEKLYGEDLQRDGYYLQKGSDAITKVAVSQALKMISAAVTPERNVTLVDLGCGAGTALVTFCQNKLNRHGIGIDIDPKISEAAGQNIARSGLQKTARIINADILAIDQWQKYIPQSGEVFFLASGVLHEFLKFGDVFVVQFLQNLKSLFPKSHFVLIEYDALGLEELKRTEDVERKLYAADYLLMHPFSAQGLPQSRYKWEQLFKSAGWFLTESEAAPLPSHLVTFHYQAAESPPR